MSSTFNLTKSRRLHNLSYAIRGPIFDKAQEIEDSGEKVLHLNIGNPAPFGFDVSDEMISAMATQLRNAQGYSHHLGIPEARTAVEYYMKSIGVEEAASEHIFIGNGVSELILMTMEAMLNEGDEVLVPSPDYPLWTAAVSLAGGRPVHYLCDEAADWNPDINDIIRKISPRTKAIVIINPNNPTGAVYDKSVLQSIVNIAAAHQLVVLSDEIYDKVLYDGNVHQPVAALGKDGLFLTYGGLSKNYMAAGFRAGWVVMTGKTNAATSFIEGMNLLASMRLCSNVPAQHLIATALNGQQFIHQLTAPGGRLFEQRNLMYDLLTEIPGISCVKPKGALYLFPKIDLQKLDIADDEDFAFRLLEEHKVLLVPGRGFNYVYRDHIRIVFLPEADILRSAAASIRDFMTIKTISNLSFEAV
jgi:alanine-synthesizing transaminase